MGWIPGIAFVPAHLRQLWIISPEAQMLAGDPLGMLSVISALSGLRARLLSRIHFPVECSVYELHRQAQKQKGELPKGRD